MPDCCMHQGSRGSKAPFYSHRTDNHEHSCLGREGAEERPSPSLPCTPLPEIDTLGKNFHRLRASVKVRGWGESVWKMPFGNRERKAGTQAGSTGRQRRRKTVGPVTRERDRIKKWEENYPLARGLALHGPLPHLSPHLGGNSVAPRCLQKWGVGEAWAAEVFSVPAATTELWMCPVIGARAQEGLLSTHSPGHSVHAYQGLHRSPGLCPRWQGDGLHPCFHGSHCLNGGDRHFTS